MKRRNLVLLGAKGSGGSTPKTELEQKYEGATVFRIETLKDEREIGFAPFRKNTSYKDFSYMIDWGDGSAIEEIDTVSRIYHIYNKKGIYDINCYNFNEKHYIYTKQEIQSVNGVQYLNAFDNPKNDSYSFSYTNNKEYDYKCTNILVGNNLEIYDLSDNPYLETIYIRYIPTSSSLASAYNKYSNNTNLRIVKSDFDLYIDRGYFNNCINLESIITPNGVILMNESSLFAGCKRLKNITLKTSSYKQIPSYTFQNCSSLTSITIPESVTTIYSSAFSGCSALQNITIPNSVTSIQGSAFSGCTALQNITIPNSVTSIQGSTFYNCTALQNITIPESVTSIGSNAFYNCTALQSVTVNAMTAPTIQSNTFPTSSFKYTKRYLYVPKDSVGYDEGNWKTYLIDKGWELRYIEEHVKTPTTMKFKTKNNFLHDFKAIGQANLVDYELVDNEYIYHFDDKIEEIIGYTFYNNVLEEIELPESVTKIGSSAFSGCTALQNITIPNSVTTIYSSAFSGCSALQNITIPNSVTTIGTYAFYNCSSLQSVVIPEGVTKIDSYAFSGCTALQNITIPNSVTTIGTYAFQYCSALQNITIPNSVTTIYTSAFQYCSALQSVVIPEGVTSISESVFSGCTALQSVTVNAMTAPTIQYNTFYNVGTKVPSGTSKILRVPKGATGYDEGNWKTYLINKGYTLEYIEPEEPIEPDYTEYTDMLYFAPSKHTTNVQVKISEDCIVDEFKYTTSPLFNTDIKSLNYDELNYPTVSKGETIEISSLSGTSILWKGALRNSSSVDTPIFEVITDKEEDNEVQVQGELNNGSFDYAYYYMLSGNTALSYIGTGFSLTAEYVGRSAYQNMFFNCSNFNDGGDIHISAKVVEPYGLGAMFSGCSNLLGAPYLNVEQVDEWGMAYMFANTAITTAPELKATKLATYCYKNTFEGCTNLNYVKHHITDWNELYTENWLKDVASEGTMYCPLNTTIPSGASGIPSGWIRVNIE